MWSSKNVTILLNTLERECLIFLSTRIVTQENLQGLIYEFLYTQPEHLLLILAKEVQHDDAISTILAQSKPHQSNILIERVIGHLNDILFQIIKTYYFQTKY
ncbi:MAG: histidine kinase [Proteobacteria bacterium]|nr:histidine kinase [Pseudomonadota bacterium]